MNNYPNFKNFNYTNMYNNSNDSFNNPYDNLFKSMNNSNNMEKDNNVSKTTTLYSPYNGYIRGNLFKSLYEPYKEDEPYDIKPMNDQAKLLTDIDALGFAMIDLNLFLDVNPNNRDAINLFNQYRNEKDNLTNEYESKYGPLSIDSNSLNSYPWAWNNMPWPWDN